MTDLDAHTGRVLADIKRHGPDLLPGAAERLAGTWSHLGALPAPLRAEKIVEQLAAPAIARFKDPEFVRPALANGAAPSPLRVALMNHADRLAGGEAKVEELMGAWGVGLSGHSPAKLASEIVRRLELRENWQHLADPPSPPASELEIRGILAANFPELSTRGADDLAQAMDRSPRFAHSRQPHEVIRQAAYDLTLPPSAAKYTAAGKALAKDDPRILAPVQPPTPAGGEARVPLGKI